jgi:hypothetical protein
MKCIPQVDGITILREIHEGECGHHAPAGSLIAKAFRYGFYWPTAKAAVDRIMELCQGCQIYSKQTHMPATALHTIPITWPFTVWGLDMVGPLKTAPSGFMHLLVAVDKFMKWVEDKPIRKLDGKTALKFDKDIVVRFGIPHNIITAMALTCLREKLTNTAITMESTLTLHLWHIHNPMARLKGPMD